MRFWVACAALLVAGGLSVSRGMYIKIAYYPSVSRATPNAGGGPPGAVGGAVRPPGAGGGLGGLGRPGTGPGNLPQPGANPGGGTADEDIDLDPSGIGEEITIEARAPRQTALGWEIGTRFAKMRITLVKDADIELIPIKLDSPEQGYKKKKEEKPDDKKDADDWRDLAGWCLKHGMIKEFEGAIDGLRSKAPDDPVAANVGKVKEAMDRRPEKDDPRLAAIRKALGGFEEMTSPQNHYALLYQSDTGLISKPELSEGLAMVENHYRGFYYWFAFRGRVLAVPDYRLGIIMITHANDFKTLRTTVFDSPPVVGQGFYSPRENVLVLCGERLDPAAQFLRTYVADLASREWVPSKLINGPSLRGAVPPRTPPREIATAQTKVLLAKALWANAQAATLTHIGTQQLLSGSGLIPPHVQPPQWLSFGMASFFEKPKEAYWAGFGGPNWLYLPWFKKLAKTEDPGIAIRKVITDQYFAEIGPAEEPDKTTKARAMAWSLTYYLADKQSGGLRRFVDELAQLPRDMVFDESTLAAAFARAFNLLQSDGTTIDGDKLTELGRRWFGDMQLQKLDYNENENRLVKELRRKQAEQRKPKPKAPAGQQGNTRPGGGGDSGGGGG